MPTEGQHRELTERFMAPFAKQGPGNKVIGIDAEGLIQRLLLFDHCIVPTIWLEDIQLLLRIVEPEALCELMDEGAISFYIDSSTAAETGQARSSLNLTGNVTRLNDNEFSFSTIRSANEAQSVKAAISNLARTEGVSKASAFSVAERVEASMLEPKGLQILAESFKAFRGDLRTEDPTLIRNLIARRLQLLGAKPTRLEVKVEEFVQEDFRITSNLTTFFGLSSLKAREISLRALLDLSSIHIRLAHMREFSCLLGMNEDEQNPWEMKVDALVRTFAHESQRDRQFFRVAKIAGLGERQLLAGGTLDLRRLIKLRHSEDIARFKDWLKRSDGKSDEEIRDQVSSIRGKIGNAVQSTTGKSVRLMISTLIGAIPIPQIAFPSGLMFGALDSFLLERILPRDAIVSVLGREYPGIFQK